MRPIIPHILLLVVSFMLCAMASCWSHSNATADGYRDRYLGMEISEADNHKLYHEIKSLFKFYSATFLLQLVSPFPLPNRT